MIPPQPVIQPPMHDDQPLIGPVVEEDAGHRQSHRSSGGTQLHAVTDLEAMPLGIGFRDDNAVQFRKAGPQRPAIDILEAEPGSVQIGRVQRQQFALAEVRRDEQSTSGPGAIDARNRRQPRFQVIGQQRAGAGRGTGRGDIDIGLQDLIQPLGDGAAKTLDHGADPDAHRDGNGQRGDGEGGPAQRGGYAPRRQPHQPAARQPGEAAGESDHGQQQNRCQQAVTQQQQEDADDGRHQPGPIPTQQTGGHGQPDQAGQGQPGQRPAGGALDAGTGTALQR